MNTIRRTSSRLSDWQFSIRSLLEFVTICSVLLAFSPVIGASACVLLILMATAICLKRGAVALFLLMLISLAAESPDITFGTATPFTRQVLVMLLAGSLCGWYYVRRRYMNGDT